MDKNLSIIVGVSTLLISLVGLMLLTENENAIITDNCKQTNLYVIGNKSHITRVYDCTGIEIK